MGFPLTGFLNNLQNKYVLLALVIVCGGCAKTSPQFEQVLQQQPENRTADDIFALTLEKHGGANLDELNDLNLAIDGEWHFLVTQIQPLIADADYRQQSEERLLLNEQLYFANYKGDGGNKQVYRTPNEIKVAYNGEITRDEQKNSAAALTADAFYLFTLGPLALHERVKNWQRLPDTTEDGNGYYRINARLAPGFGLSERDFVTLWVNKQSALTYRVHITLDGFDATKGAHADTTYLKYTEIDGFTFPTHFFERVRGPISIDAHEWWYTGIDINRGLTAQDLSINALSLKAKQPAIAINGTD